MRHLVVTALALPLAIQCQTSIRGFSADRVPSEVRLEQQARAIPEAANIRNYADRVAAQPHNAGSEASHETAEYLLKQLKSWGLDARIEQFEALMPFPTIREVELTAPHRYVLKLKEPPVAQDPDSTDPGQLPTYNAYGADGDIRAEVVYVNYGLPEDYAWLGKQGISVKGKIVLARYGKSWRGIKPKVAYEHGAIGCLIYSDPRDDGYFESDPYPKGPMRPAGGVQRGSVMDMTLYPGDPLSPGWASEAGGRKLPLSEAKTLMKIPVLPISYSDAEPILSQLGGPVAPKDWRGALPFTYHVGSGPSEVHMHVAYDWSSRPLYDVIATIPGSEFPDEWLLAGNHHDAWVNGADDPVSGLAALMETARTLSMLRAQGWKPRRTIKLTFWDGEEFGLLGSTEWVEKHQDELKKKAIAYFNSDDTGKGTLSLGGSHLYQKFIADVADTVPQPASNLSTAAYAIHNADSQHGFTMGAIGAGSDFQGFLDYLGVASVNAAFEGMSPGGVYHSIYDSLYWYNHFSDSSRVYGRALSQYTTTALLRLAGTSILPVQFGMFADTVSGYVDEITTEAEHNGHKLDVASLRKQLQQLKENGQNYDALLEVTVQKARLDPDKLEALNQTLIRTERVLTRPEGLPNRPWYKNQIYAPGFYTGYAVKTLPGIREAVEAQNWRLAQQETVIVGQCLADLNGVVREAIEDMSGL